MKIAELRGKSIDELNEVCLNFKKELFNLRIQKSTGEISSTSRIKIVRRSIARVKTLLNEMAQKAGGKNA